MLLLAVVVLLVVMAVMFVSGVVTPAPAPPAAFETDTNESAVTLSYTAGEKIPESRLVLVTGEKRKRGLDFTGDGDTDDVVSAGQTYSVEEVGREVSLVWRTPDNSAVLASYDVPERLTRPNRLSFPGGESLPGLRRVKIVVSIDGNVTVVETDLADGSFTASEVTGDPSIFSNTSISGSGLSDGTFDGGDTVTLPINGSSVEGADSVQTYLQGTVDDTDGTAGDTTSSSSGVYVVEGSFDGSYSDGSDGGSGGDGGGDSSGGSTGDGSDGNTSTDSGLTAVTGPDFTAYTTDDITFEAIAYGSGYTVESYNWTMGDGTRRAGQTVTHSYDQPGTYRVTLTVTDSQNNTASDVVNVTILDGRTPETSPKAVTADAAANRTTITAGQAVAFDGTGSTGENLTYEWDFGDGRTATGPTATRRFDDPGEYAVALTVYNESDVATDTVNLTVENAPPTAALAAPDEVTNGTAVTFDASNSSDFEGPIATYGWDFDGDGTVERTTSSATTTHTYDGPGTYTAAVTVADGAGATDTATERVTVETQVSQTCSDLPAGATSGTYTIDPDGDGGVAPFEVYCEMGENGGGWIKLTPYEKDTPVSETPYAVSVEQHNRNGIEDGDGEVGEVTSTGYGDPFQHLDVAAGCRSCSDFFHFNEVDVLVRECVRCGVASESDTIHLGYKSAGNRLTAAQVDAIRNAIVGMSSTTEMALTTTDNDNREDTRIKIYDPQGRSKDLVPGNSESDADYRWSTTRLRVQCEDDSCSGEYDPNDTLPESFVLPTKVWVFNKNGGGGVWWYEKKYVLVK